MSVTFSSLKKIELVISRISYLARKIEDLRANELKHYYELEEYIAIRWMLGKYLLSDRASPGLVDKVENLLKEYKVTVNYEQPNELEKETNL